jgi:hypothetical protein
MLMTNCPWTRKYNSLKSSKHTLATTCCSWVQVILKTEIESPNCRPGRQFSTGADAASGQISFPLASSEFVRSGSTSATYNISQRVLI